MRVRNIIRLFYILYTVYTVFVMSVSNYPFVYAALGLLTIWMIYFAFSFGYSSVSISDSPPIQKADKVKSTFPFSAVAEWKAGTYIINAAACWFCTIVAAQYYTGQGFGTVLQNITKNQSSYYTYQAYLKAADISTFSFHKVPYILMLTYLTAMLFFGALGILLSGRKIKAKQVFYLISVLLSYLYFGLARGTNFEMYTVFIVVTYCLINREKAGSILKRIKSNSKSILAVCIIGIIMVFVFRTVVSNRGIALEEIRICTEIEYNPNSIVAELFPELTNIALSVFGYLGFGIFALGVTVSDILLNSITGLTSSLIPFGFELIGGETLPNLLRDTIDIGVRWVPDGVTFIGLFGLPIFFILLFLMGRMMASCRFSSMPPLLANLLCAAAFWEMISIPVGNFIINSTPNKLLILVIALWWIKWRFLYYKKESHSKITRPGNRNEAIKKSESIT